MASIFDLKTSASELPSINQGCADYQYQQITSTAPVEGASFPNSTKRYRWDISGNTWWIPSRSYIRLRVQYSGPLGSPISLVDDVAPSMDMPGNLFQSLEFNINNKTVCKLEDNVPQINSIHQRMVKSKAWLDSIGADAEVWQPDFATRQALIATRVNLADPLSYNVTPLIGNNGYTVATMLAITVATGLHTFTVAGANTDQFFRLGDLIYYPGTAFTNQYLVVTEIPAGTGTLIANTYEPEINLPLPGAPIGATALNNAIFGIVGPYRVRANTPAHPTFETVWQPPLSIFSIESALPAGQYQLSLTPQTNDRYKKASVQSLEFNIAAPVSFDFSVVDMFLYIATVSGPRIDNMTYYISLDEINAQPIAVSASNALQKKQFDVAPSTYQLTVGFQSQNVTADTRNPASMLKFSGTSSDTDLKQLYLQYAGQTRPSPYADPQYNPTTDYLDQHFIENMLYTGLYFNQGGSESKTDWITRGPYYTFSWPKDGSSESTRAYVNFQFGTAPADGDANVFLFSHYRTTTAITVADSRVVSVEQQTQ
jgi:hypothetical protein